MHPFLGVFVKRVKTEFLDIELLSFNFVFIDTFALSLL